MNYIIAKCITGEEMATHYSILAWKIPRTGAWWAIVYGVTKSQHN